MALFTPIYHHTPAGLVPTWYPTSAFVNDIREWDVSVTPTGTTLPQPVPNNRLSVCLYRILLEAGIAFTQGVGLQLPSMSSLAPLYRYIDLFSGTSPRLRLISGLQNVDSRFKQLIGEEIGIGISFYVLKEHLDVIHIADVGPLLVPPAGQASLVSFVQNNSDEKRPDFYCETTTQEVVFAESKGAVGPQSKMTGPSGPIQKGWHQVHNVMPTTAQVRTNCGRVVIGTNIQLDLPSVRSDSMTHIRDPIGPDQKQLEEPNDFPIRVSYAKNLRYAGQIILAELLISREQWPIPGDPQTIQWNNLQLVPIGVAPIGGLITIERRVWSILRDNHLGSIRSQLEPIPLDQVQMTPEQIENAIVFRNGIVVLLDEDTVGQDVLFVPHAPSFFFPRFF